MNKGIKLVSTIKIYGLKCFDFKIKMCLRSGLIFPTIIYTCFWTHENIHEKIFHKFTKKYCTRDEFVLYFSQVKGRDERRTDEERKLENMEYRGYDPIYGKWV